MKTRRATIHEGVRPEPSVFLSDFDLHLISEGTQERLYDKLGAHSAEVDGQPGTRFAVWAPNAERVSIIGDFNGWNADANPMTLRGAFGVWEGFVPEIGPGALYKYSILSKHRGYLVEKADPLGFASELRPRTASKVWDHGSYSWGDADWMARRRIAADRRSPISIYELHLGSWMRVQEEEDRWLTYRELAPKLAQYVRDLGFTHVEFLPVTEHPFDGSWGYQTIGYFCPTSRFGTPDDFKHLVDTLHQAGIGVILDWAPAHFPSDAAGLGYFDGTHLYEHADPRKGLHPDWNTLIFNYGRNEVTGFLLSCALFWLDHYHIDGLRTDAVASMLYLDYSRGPSEWVPNEHGGRENLQAIAFLRNLNERLYARFPDVFTAAEESTSWPMVSRPTYLGGLGFGYKWDMGWMHDTLAYMGQDPIHRRFHHQKLTFRILYAFHENFILPLSHDEVVHGKGSLVGKMPGDEWQKFANLRLLLSTQFTQPGKKLLFMGSELAPWTEWNHDRGLDWSLLEHARHRGIWRLVQDLNRTYRAEPALHDGDTEKSGFEWIDCNDAPQSVTAFLRKGSDPDDLVAVVMNYTPVPRHNYRIGVPRAGEWKEIFNSDADEYGGSGQGNLGGVLTAPASLHGHEQSLTLVLPPLAMAAFRWVRAEILPVPDRAA